jgi:UDP-GlcNAc:undecaprenyl-phosphate GlcNAc-1-phosphate transferase
MSPIYLVFLYFTVTVILSLLLTPAVIKLANLRGWIVTPRADRWHTKPTALMGGIGIFVSFTLMFSISSIHFETDWLIYVAFFLMFLTGFLDDLFELKPIYKLFSQILATTLLIFDGYIFGNGELGFIGFPITFLFVIGITNAINLLDNMDGLSAGVSMIIAFIAGILSIQQSNFPLALLSMLVAGSALGFLFFNFNPAKIFMGDSGSLFLGFSLSFLTISVQKTIGNHSIYIVLLLPLALLALPILDTSLVSIKRLISGRKIYLGGKDHSSHRLVAFGLSEKKAVILLYGVTLVWGLVSVFLINSNSRELYLPAIVVLVVLTSFFGLFLGRVRVYNESEEKLAYLRMRGQYLKKGGIMLRFLLMNKKVIVGVSFDILVISTAFYISGLVNGIDLTRFNSFLAIMIALKILINYLYKSYRKSWRYTSIADINTFLLSGIISSLLSFVIHHLFFKQNNLSNLFFILDFFLTFMGVLFLRSVFRYIQHTVLRFRFFQKRALILGVGEMGTLLCRQLFISEKMSIKPVGFIDDDPSLRDLIINGVEVLGSTKDIQNICRMTNATDVILTSSKMSTDKMNSIKKDLDAIGVNFTKFTWNITDV